MHTTTRSAVRAPRAVEGRPQRQPRRPERRQSTRAAQIRAALQEG